MRLFSWALLTLVALAAGPASANPGGTYDGSGAYLYQYGTAMAPPMSCAPNHVCEIALQSGETIYDIVSGDTVHFVIGRGAEGKGGSVPVVFFQPLDSCLRDGTTGVCAGELTTNVIITTDRRTYDVRLSAGSSGRTRYGFTYPGDAPMHTTPIGNAPPPVSYSEPSISSGGCLQTARDYRIDVSGSPDYVPLIVCNDGLRTFLSMPARYTAPSIYTVLSNGQQQLVDTHPNLDGIYAISGLPYHILLIGETGRNVAHVDVWKLH